MHTHTHTHTHTSTHVKCKQYACSTIPMVLIEKMFAITNLLCWTNVNSSQPVSQLAAKLGSGSARCGLHSCGRFWTWWWTVWVVPTFSVYFPKSLGHQKTLRLNPFSCSWTHLAIPHEKGNVSMINITVSACQHAIINYVCWNISLWIQRHSLVVFLLRASWCFDIRALLKETNLLPASGQDGCVESHSPDQIPHGRWATGPVLGSAPLSLPFPAFSFPLIHPLRFPSQGLFHLELLEIPLSVERHPSLALSNHFRRTCDSAENEYDKHLNLSGRCENDYWLVQGKEILWQGKCLCLDDSRRGSAGQCQYFRGRAVKLYRSVFVYLDKLDKG